MQVSAGTAGQHELSRCSRLESRSSRCFFTGNQIHCTLCTNVAGVIQCGLFMAACLCIWVSLVKSFRKDGSFACLRSMLCDSKTPRWPLCRISYFPRNEFRGISIWCSLKYSSFFLSFVCILYESISELNVKRPSAKNRQLASVSSWR